MEWNGYVPLARVGDIYLHDRPLGRESVTYTHSLSSPLLSSTNQQKDIHTSLLNIVVLEQEQEQEQDKHKQQTNR